MKEVCKASSVGKLDCPSPLWAISLPGISTVLMSTNSLKPVLLSFCGNLATSAWLITFLAIGNQLKLLVLLPTPPLGLVDGTKGSSPLITGLFSWQSALILKPSRSPSTSHLISIQKDITSEIPAVVGAVCEKAVSETKYVFLLASHYHSSCNESILHWVS